MAETKIASTSTPGVERLEPSPHELPITDHALPASELTGESLIGGRHLVVASESDQGGEPWAEEELATSLAHAGLKVDLLFFGRERQQANPELARRCQAEGVKLVMLGPATIKLRASRAQQNSHDLMTWLLQRDANYRTIYFAEREGIGYFSVLARHQGLGLAGTVFCAGLTGPSPWRRAVQMQLARHVDQLEIDFMERESVSLADLVVAETGHLLDWAVRAGWNLPERRFVQTPLIPVSDTPKPAATRAHPAPIREILFIGASGSQPSLQLFCRAVGELKPAAGSVCTVTFLAFSGNARDIRSEIRRKANDWQVRWRVQRSRSWSDTRKRLTAPGKLAVFSGDVDRRMVLDCLRAGVPFLVGTAGGLAEYIHSEDRARLGYQPFPGPLAASLQRALSENVVPGRPACGESEAEKNWAAWLFGAPPASAQETNTLEKAETPPAAVVSVCLVHFARPELLRIALASLRTQNYPQMEVVLVDCGGSDSASHLQELAPEFAARGWKIVVTEDRFLGAARNMAAAKANGEYLLFMDDDNVALPAEISTLIRVARRTKADLVTSARYFFGGSGEPPSTPKDIAVSMGPAVAAGLYRNVFGDANALVRRETFVALGGFGEIYGLGHEDWHFFALACLRGCHLEAVPLPLYWYRETPAALTKRLAGSLAGNHRVSLGSFLEYGDPKLTGALELGLGLQVTELEAQARKANRPAQWGRWMALLVVVLILAAAAWCLARYALAGTE